MNLLKLFPVVLILLFIATSAFAENINFANDRFQISLSYPNTFQSIPPKDSNILLVLSNQTLNCNFNILTVPSNYDASLPIGKQNRLLLDSYGKVGISDAIIRSSELIRVAERPSFSAELAYNYGNNGYIANVIIIPADSFHFVATMISPAGYYDAEDLAVFFGIIKSIKLPSYVEEKKEETKDGFFSRLFSKSSSEEDEAKAEKEETAKAVNKPVAQPLELPDTAGSIVVILCLIGLFAILTKKR